MVAVVAGLLIRSRPEDMGLGQVGGANPGPVTSSAQGTPPPLQWGQIYKKGKIWYLGVVYFMWGFSYIIYMTFFAAYLVKQMGVSASEAGGMWAMVGGLSIFCGVIWGWLSDKLGRGKGLGFAYLAQAVSFGVFAVAPFEVGFYFSAVLFGLSAWAVPTIMAAAAGDYVGPRLAPAGLGFITLFFGIGQALGPGVGGYLADVTQSFTTSFLLACAVALLGAALSLGLRKGVEHSNG